MESSKTLLENVQLFDGAGRFQDTITASGRFVGLEITPKRINNIKLILDFIGLQFTEAQDVTMYMFHSSRPANIGTQDITISTANTFAWQKAGLGVGATTPIVFNYVDHANDIDSGGKYYVGYFESIISGKAINKQNQFSSCNGCSDIDSRLYNLWNKFFDVRAIEVASGDLNGTSLWDLSRTGYTQDTNFGINLSLSVKTDVTEILKSNKAVFTDALGYQYAYDAVEEMAFLPAARLNRLGDNVQKEARFVIESETLKNRLEDAVKALGFDFSQISQVLPKDRKKRLHFGAM